MKESFVYDYQEMICSDIVSLLLLFQLLCFLKIVYCDNMSSAEVFDEKSDMKSIVGSVVMEIKCRVIVGWYLWIFPFRLMLLLSGLSRL